MKHIKEVYPKPPSPCYCLNLRRASRAVTQLYDEILKPSGLTVAQLALLSNLEVAEQATINELSKILRVDRTTLNRNMKPLADAGFIEINPGKDSRTRQIKLTKAGKDVVASGMVLWKGAQGTMKEYVGKEELAMLKQLLPKLEALVP
ncbi:MarR family winged helix-turn-helix transcriptional regulator [Sporomusa aerivorans]|uniref:MarR family winged helix-turn-helix transcriptional regulator n=1 Tax=Sporomusa aerivorans TaxID=204936 RepID=UPI00352B6A34